MLGRTADFEAPKRYLVESDSDSEREEASPKQKEVQISIQGDLHEGSKLVVCLNDAGETWSNGIAKTQELATVTTQDQEQCGSFVQASDSLVLLASSIYLPLASLYPLVEKIYQACEPTSVQVIESYSVDNYLSSSPASPTVRSLQTPAYPSSSLPQYEIPNMLLKFCFSPRLPRVLVCTRHDLRGSTILLQSQTPLPVAMRKQIQSFFRL